ncbi:MAG: 23S rRNA (cytosine1962-C5)-methyltransferase [Candidatus Krumholzibacteriia bacterium]|jgi:23S rRNA (cytosine1962-C5)-methyltransferase
MPLPMNEAQRLFHGRSGLFEGLGHVTVDWLPPVVLITMHSPEQGPWIENLAKGLRELLPDCSSVQSQRRYERHGPVEVIWGDEITEWEVKESGLKYRVSLGRARNTGLFLDMKNGRQWVREHSHGKRVLNLFAYTCGFSVAAAEGGASTILNADLSSTGLSIGRDNHRLNKQSLSGVSFAKLDIFKSFGRFKNRGPFDLLICDPPTFQKDSVDIVRDYPKILRRIDQFMAPGAQVMLCLNAPDMSADFLVSQMAEFAPRYGHEQTLAASRGFAEESGKGLKVLIFGQKPLAQGPAKG